MISRTMAGCAVALLLLASSGCGVFKSSTSQGSSESISNSVSSPFKWSSKSSGSTGGDSASSIDVREATELWAREGDDVDVLRRDVGRIAESHGVTDWEADPGTFDAMGRGLRRAQVEEARFDALSSELAAGDAHALAWIRGGYAAEAVN